MPQHPNPGEIDRILRHAHFPQVVEFLRCYSAIHPRDRLPSLADFYLGTRPMLQRYCLLAAVEPDPEGGAAPVFRILSAGAELAQTFAFSLTGRRLDEIAASDDPGFRYAAAIAADVVRRRQLVHSCGPTRLKHSDTFTMVEYCSCPVAADGHTVDHIVTIMVYEAAPATAATSA